MSAMPRFFLGLLTTVSLSLLALRVFTYSFSWSNVQALQIPISQWLSTLSIPISPVSLPFSSPGQPTDSDYLSYDLDHDISNWNLTQNPAYTTSNSNLIFTTASSLLQHWPNARYRNGHTIVPGRIPIGTIFYHGRSSPDMVESSKAGQKSGADAESTKEKEKEKEKAKAKKTKGDGDDCWFITLVTTRELRVLYFDGSSAAKMIGGSMDSQDAFAYRDELELEAEKAEEQKDAPSRWDDPGRIFGEVERLRRLCQWVEEQGLGVDGFVRMEMDFEVMLCDMSSGMDVLSFVNLAHSANPNSPSNFFSPGPDPSSSSTLDSTSSQSNHVPMANPRITIRNFELAHSASQHNAFPGEMKIKLDMDGLVSFYDEELVRKSPYFVDNDNDNHNHDDAPDRWTHQVRRVSKEDARRVRERVEEVLLRQKEMKAQGASGIDWQLLIQMLIKRYASRLETLEYLLAVGVRGLPEAGEGEGGIGIARMDSERVQTVFDQLEVALSPFILADAVPAPSPAVVTEKSKSGSTASSLDWASSVYKLCATTHTLYLHSPHILRKMTKSERTLLKAVEGSNKEICRVLVTFWAEGVENGLGLENMYHIKKGTNTQMGSLRQRWEKDLKVLMDWLDWSVWQRCRPACGPEACFLEMCYMPTWPYFAGTGGPPAGPAQGPDGMDTNAQSNRDDWERPKPMCIRRIAPYDF
ncbi:hypothetical protein D9758_014985 [Tetrapyrgos nigripes]|uniref:Uncharacterized protein n=1 Tax=Tetrapyrgos nigripes TaxID=182062 RepID=A0A8H5CE88_9AGAR|nr:hypothetical protein D9758_014985 [Tetrapyrgos nigripes]